MAFIESMKRLTDYFKTAVPQCDINDVDLHKRPVGPHMTPVTHSCFVDIISNCTMMQHLFNIASSMLVHIR